MRAGWLNAMTRRSRVSRSAAGSLGAARLTVGLHGCPGAVGGEGTQKLDGDERVPACAAQRGEACRVHVGAGHVGRERGDRVVVDRAELEMDRAQLGAAVHHVSEVIGPRRGAERDHEQDAEVAVASGERPQRRERGAVGPVHVVDREQHRSVPGEALDVVHERVLEEVAAVVAPLTVEEPGAVGWPERFDERAEGPLLLELLGATSPDRDAERVGGDRELVQEPGLADPGLAFEEHHPPVAPGGVVEDGPKHRELVAPPAQLGRHHPGASYGIRARTDARSPRIPHAGATDPVLRSRVMRALTRRLIHVAAPILLALGLVAGAGTAAGALQPYVFLAQWGSSGSGNGQFQSATDGAVDSDGNVYVVDEALGRVQKFTAGGTFIKAWTRGCKICTPFASPHGVAAGNGVVWVADTGNSRLVKFDTNGNQLLVVPVGAAFAIDIDTAGNVYVVAGAFAGDSVQEYNSAGTFVRTFNTGFSFGNGAVALGPNNNVYVFGADNTTPRVKVFSRFGTVLSTFTPPGGVGLPGIGVDRLGRIYVSDTVATINVMTLQGQLLGSFGTPGTGPLQFTSPVVAVPDAVGVLYVVDNGNDRIQKITETSTLTISVTDDVEPTPYTVTVTNGPTPVPSFQLDDDPASPLPQQQSLATLVPGVYRVTIFGGPNTPKTITCSNGQQVQNYGSNHIDVTLLAGTNVSCNFYVEWIG